MRLFAGAVSLVLLSSMLRVANAQQGVMAYWPFDTMVSDTFKDNSGNGYNGIVSGSAAVLVPGIKGNAVECPIGGGYDIAVANSATSFVLNHFTFEAWVWSDTITGGQQNILNFQDVPSGVRNGYSFTLNAGRPAIEAATSDGTNYVNDIAAAVLQTKTWYYLTATFDSLNYRIYVNGVLQGTAAAMAGGIRPPGTNANIGCQSQAGNLSSFFGGKIDELKVYNYALPADSIVAHYQTITPPPVLVSPANGTLNQPITPTLAWGSVSGATYTLQVSTTTSFSTVTVSATGLNGLSSAPAGLAATTTYYWRVNAANGASTSTWSSVWSFTTAPPAPGVPVLASPANGASSQPLTLNFIWNASANAVSYSIQLSTSSGFTTTVSNQGGLTGITTSVSGLSANDTCFWRVNATNGGGTSAWSAVWSFATILVAPPVPVLLSPATGTTSQPTASKLYWNAATGATVYSVQVSTSSAFSTAAVSQTGVTATSASVNGLANGTTYFWEVNATGPGGTSLWSSVWSFVTVAAIPPVPALSSPTNGSLNEPLSPTISWGSAAGAASYGVQVATSTGFTTTVSSQTGLTGTAFGVNNLIAGTTYYWKVNATNGGGSSAWSSTWSFTTLALPAAPALVSPSNNAIFVKNTGIMLTWSTVATATSYTVQISTSTTFGSIYLSQAGQPTSEQFTAIHGYPYYWRVNATNAAGTGLWSGIWTLNPSVSVLTSSPQNGSRELTVRQGILGYCLPKAEQVEISIFDALGRTVVSINRAQGAGSHSIDLINSSLTPGRYIVRFKAGGIAQERAITVSQQH
jgi:hypothetical protein